ncbi:MAG: PAS domain S-box protein [Xanthobacteraceae bacterium]|nr:PAS domain S-box protein [Xanthobacteraceae bacterium]
MNLAAALIYWVIVALWLAVLGIVALTYVRNPRTFGPMRFLLAVVAIDTTRNIVENLYFGLYFGAQYGIFPGAIAGVLGNPNYLIIPKLINIAAACVVLWLLLLRWVPGAVQERALADDALKQETEERRRLFETSLDLILIMDSEGGLLRVSPSSSAILGYAPDETIGRHAFDFIHDDDRDRMRAQMRSSRAGNHLQNFETRFLHKQGSIVAVALSGVWSEPEQKYFFIGRDMTKRHRAEEALRDSEEMARGIINTALDAFVQIDETGSITEWSTQAEAMFGWPRQEVIGKTLDAVIVPETQRYPRDAGIARFVLTGEQAGPGKRLEVEAVRRDGRPIKIELSVTALRRRSGTSFNAFIRDVTEKLAKEEQYRQAQKMEAVGQLTGGIAHDFNNMLTVIIGSSELLGAMVADKPELAELAKTIDEAAELGADLTKRLLAFARKQPLQPRQTDIAALLNESARLLRPTLGENINIEMRVADGTWPALVDPGQLGAALVNLAVNARDAMPDGGKLAFETANVLLDDTSVSELPPLVSGQAAIRHGEYVMIAVSDTGSGIPAEIREKIFEPFFTTKEIGKGTGLGLSMVYGFVKQSGGHINVYSEDRYGTTIRIYLPRAACEGDQGSAVEAADLPRGHETILVVEDSGPLRRQVDRQLDSLGYTVLAASNAAEALALLDQGRKPDLLFTDVIMPGGMNGQQLAHEATKRLPSMKVLYTSGFTKSALINQGRLVPGVTLLSKPYRKTELARSLRSALDAGTEGPAHKAA